MKLSKIQLFSVILLICFRFGFSQLIFDDNFDNGCLDSVSQNGNLYTVAPTSFLHFRISGAVNQSPEFRVYQGSDYVFRNNHRMVFRYESESTWHYMDTGYVAGDYYYFNHNSPFSSDTVYIAYWFPWTFGQMQDYMAQISGHPFVRNDSVRGYSYQNRPIYGYEITDISVPDSVKKKIVIVARQHAQESLGSYILKGISDYLLNANTPLSATLLQRTIFYLYPMGNPDGVFLGSGYGGPVYLNMNRFWFSGTPAVNGPSGCIETDVLRQAIWDDTDGQADYGFDFHSHPGHMGKYYWWGLLSGPNQHMVNAASQLVQRIHYHDSTDHGGVAIIAGQIANDTWGTPGPYADYWLCETMGAISYTLEPGSVPPQELSRISAVGEAFCKGLYDVIDTMATPVMSQPMTVVSNLQLYQNYPNPFNPATTITYFLPQQLAVELTVFNLLGEKVKTLVQRVQARGSHSVKWDGRNENGLSVGSGVYFYQLKSGSQILTGKMMLLH